MIIVFDLEGPLSPMDFAADAMAIIGRKLGRADFFEVFKMLSIYDDVLALEKRPNYEAGDTLRLVAPIIASQLSDEEMMRLSKTATLTPGAKELIRSLNLDEVYVISTSYQQHAYTTTEQLGIKKNHVYCTKLPLYKEFPYMRGLLDIYEIYKKSGIEKVRKDLDTLFWEELDPVYLKTEVRGGIRKGEAIEEISKKIDVPISEFVAVGDSITDSNMLKVVSDGGGVAISFNGNEFSVPNANLAVSAKSLIALKPVIDSFPNVWSFVEKWNKEHNPDFRPRYDDLRNMKKFDDVVRAQKEMRMLMRKRHGELG